MLRVPRPLLRTLNTSMPTSTNTCYCCCPQRSCLCRSFVTARACISLGRRISADTGCAGCRRAERTVQCQEKTHTHISQQPRHTWSPGLESYFWRRFPGAEASKSKVDSVFKDCPSRPFFFSFSLFLPRFALTASSGAPAEG